MQEGNTRNFWASVQESVGLVSVNARIYFSAKDILRLLKDDDYDREEVVRSLENSIEDFKDSLRKTRGTP
jgi:hypothetical protein